MRTTSTQFPEPFLLLFDMFKENCHSKMALGLEFSELNSWNAVLLQVCSCCSAARSLWAYGDNL